MVAVWHIDGTHLDSLKLTFSTLSTNVGPIIWFDAPQGSQSSNVLVYKEHGNSVVDIPDMGFMGRGSVNFDFYIQLLRPSPINGNYPLTIQADLSLHESDDIFGGSTYGHTAGYPILVHGFKGDLLVAFLIDPSGKVSKYNVNI